MHWGVFTLADVQTFLQISIPSPGEHIFLSVCLYPAICQGPAIPSGILAALNGTETVCTSSARLWDLPTFPGRETFDCEDNLELLCCPWPLSLFSPYSTAGLNYQLQLAKVKERKGFCSVRRALDADQQILAAAVMASADALLSTEQCTAPVG